MKVMRKIIIIDEELCNGCGQCIVDCAEAALEIIDGKAKLVAEKYCDGLGACLGGCPTGALTLEDREVDEFDEEAVEELIAKQKAEQEAAQAKPAQPKSTGCGCPGAAAQALQPKGMKKIDPQERAAESALGNWPVKIKLVPENAPYLKNADLLIAADCVPAAYPNLHQDYIQGRIILMGCPKFDDADFYVEKLARIFAAAGPKSVTVMEMEVPCCSGMHRLAATALDKAKVDLNVNRVIISRTGEVQQEQKVPPQSTPLIKMS